MSVFISWSGADRDVKNVIAEKLHSENITFWESDENCASDFSRECIENIRRSTIFLVIISEASMSPKSYVFNEVIEARNMENEGRLNIIVYKITDEPYTARFAMQLNHISDANNVSRVYKLGNNGGIDTLIKRVKYLTDRREKGMPEKPFDVLMPKVFGVPVTSTGYFVRDSRTEDMDKIEAAFSTSNVVVLSKLFGFGKKSTIRQYVRNHHYSSAIEVQASNHSLRSFVLNDLQFSNINDLAFDKSDEKAIIQTKLEFLKKLDETQLIIVSDVTLEEEADELVVHLLSGLRCHMVLVTQNSADTYRDYFPVISIDRMETKFLLELFFHYYDRDSTIDHDPLVPALNCFFDTIGGHTKTVEIAASVLAKEMRANSDDLVRYLTEGSDDNRTLNDRIFEKLSNLIAMESFSDEAKQALALISLVADPIIEDSELYRYMKLCGLRSRSVITELDSLRWITYNPAAHTIYIEPVIGGICISKFLDNYSIPLALFEEIRVGYEKCAARDSFSGYRFITRMEHFFRSLRMDESADVVKGMLEVGLNASADVEKMDRVCARFREWFKKIRESVSEEPTERERLLIRSSVWLTNAILPYIKACGSLSFLWNFDTSRSFSMETAADLLMDEMYEYLDNPLTLSEFESLTSTSDDESSDENKALIKMYENIMASFMDRDISALGKQLNLLIELLQNTPEYLKSIDFSDKMLLVVKTLYQGCSDIGAYQTGIEILEKLLGLDWQNYYMHQILLLYAQALLSAYGANDEILSVMMAADDLLSEIESDQSLTYETRENIKREHLLTYSLMLASCDQVDEAIEKLSEFLDLGIDMLYPGAVNCIRTIVDQLMFQKRTDKAISVIEQVLEPLHACMEKENLSESVKETVQSLLSLREMYVDSREMDFSVGGIITEKNYYQRYSSEKKNNLMKMMTYNRVANEVRKFDFSGYTDAELAAHPEKLRARAQAGEKAMKLAPEAFALVSEAGVRTLGYRHHQVQYVGAAVMLDGGIAEIINGEGKTYTITLVAFVYSLYNEKTFVLDDSPYLTERNYKWMRGLYKLLGLRVGRLIPSERRSFDDETGTENVIYSDMKTFAFNLLYRERSKEPADRRDLSCCGAIIDEADTILIECANQPYMLTNTPRSSSEYFNKCVTAYQLALRFNESDQYCTFTAGSIEFKREAYVLFEEYFGVSYDDIANSQELVKLERLVRIALFALRSVQGIDYFVKDGKVFGEDESDGSVFVVSGERGLFLSLANHLDTSGYECSISERQTLYNIIHPFGILKRFGAVSGTSATACSFKKEFKDIYGLDVVAVPPVFPVKRTDQTVSLFLKKQFKDRAIVDMIAEKHAKAQPVLLIVKNLSESYRFSKLLADRGITHSALNAINSEQSPELLASAGMPNSVLVATQVANRGVDIKLGGDAERMTMFELIEQGVDVSRIDEILYTVPSAEMLERELYRRYTVTLEKKRALVAANRKKVIESGGLCVISSEPYGDMRIEQQIRGRAGRQGAVGESYIFESMEDELYTNCFNSKQAMLSYLIDCDYEIISSKLLTKTIEVFKKKVHHKSFEKMQKAADSSRRLENAKLTFLELIDEIRAGSTTYEELVELWSEDPNNFELASDIFEKGDCKESTVKLLFREYPEIFVEGRYERTEEYLYEAAMKHLESGIRFAKLNSTILFCELDREFEKYISAMYEFESTYANKQIKNADSFFEKIYEKDQAKCLLEAIDSWIKWPL